MNWDQIVRSMRRLGRLHRLPDRFAVRTVALLGGTRPEVDDNQTTTDPVASEVAIPDASSARDGPTSPPER